MIQAQLNSEISKWNGCQVGRKYFETSTLGISHSTSTSNRFKALFWCAMDGKRRPFERLINSLMRLSSPKRTKEKNKKEESESEEDEDIETALAKERVQLSAEKKFQLCYTAGVSNFMFVKSLLDPLPIATRIIESIQKDGQQRTRYLIRLIPIHTTCKAFSGSIQASVGELIGKLNLKALSLTYCVVFKTRYNNNLTQIEALKAVNEAVKKETDGKWTIKLKESDYAIVLEYNLIELAKASQQTSLEKMEDDNKSSIAIGKTIEATNESPIKTEKTRNETINNDSDVSSLKEKEETFSQEKGSEILEEDETKIESVVESAV
ncbi:unnamed protein product [Lepeophtheirus salmonis]|uniref:(salmon louse) hypothetical protein n=1 Tax=Lepeophtheirus salmonis TaxID=72036 RepID=A0A7R8H515_LEPSM|nr:unnamed protein product [Lepeophtheirus salmonis]CAF2868645.1 unnamed protein product [Lepeophtheirus salmonis]